MASTALQKHMKKYRSYYEHNVLQPDTHSRLVEDISRIRARSGIPERYITHSAKDWCGDEEIGWLLNIPHAADEGTAGLVYTGSVTNVHERMCALAGALLRNFMDARVSSVQTLIDRLKANEDEIERVALVPNFYIGKQSGGDISSWHVAPLLGWLQDRYAKDLQTVLYVESFAGLGSEYGKFFKDHIQNHFTVIED